MPRNVRNFWLEVKIDGRSSRIETGPVSSNGGFECRILMRDSGGIVDAASLWGVVSPEGNIRLHFRPARNGIAFVVDPADSQTTIETKR